ncbi:MAG TPA: hypothetical protein GX529_08000 [Firmicutes bacterium]|nr:hypothetical protein [Candidatus Fermentithermobacillaceae bacterium]
MDLLREKARMAGMQLVYTANKRVFLSMIVRDSTMSLRVHRVFRGCSDEVAGAVIGYYTRPEFSEHYEQVVRRYITGTIDISAQDVILRPAVYKAVRETLGPVSGSGPGVTPDYHSGVVRTVDSRHQVPSGNEIEMPIQAVFRIDDGRYLELPSSKIDASVSDDIQLEIRVARGRGGEAGSKKSTRDCKHCTK